ncbi:hypothetical protein, partial [Enterobacter hormaechei]|uniref:hypothetical protein n=1 Tax=Enterobacter hormaechei TaxID=158836 RepID=UPI001CA34FBE
QSQRWETRRSPVGPRKRSAAGQELRARSHFCVGWRLTPYPTYISLPFVARAALPEDKVSDGKHDAVP